jgi:hypothetical protein
MRTAVFATMVAVIAASLWIGFAAPRTSAPGQKATISTHDLHIRSDVKSLPVQTIDHPF